MNRVTFALAALLLGLPAAAQASELKRGEYLASIMDCGGCHTPGVLVGQPDMARYLGGSEVGFQIPGLGIFYPPNLTPDDKTGLGTWSKDDIVRAVTTGERPDGRMLAPVMPWHSYSKLTVKDAQSLAVYLKSLPPVSNQVPAPVGPDDKAPGPYMTVVAP